MDSADVPVQIVREDWRHPGARSVGFPRLAFDAVAIKWR